MRWSFFPIVLALAGAAGASAGDDYKPVTQKQLQTQIPNFFFFDYTFEPEPGKRLWLRVDDATWVERYPSGKESKFQVLGRATVEDIEGTVVERAEDKGIDVFIPDKAEKMQLKFRDAGKDGPWSLLGEMKKVE